MWKLTLLLLLAAPAAAQVSNRNNCASAGIDNVGPGVYAFNNGGATTGPQGQNEDTCYKFGDSAIDNDIWFTYTATSTALATIDTCASSGTNLDTKMAAWPSGGCPADGTSLACNDDTCNFYSSLQFNVNAGQSYVIQVGNFPGAPGGTGTITISEQPPMQPPPPGGASCFSNRAAFIASCGPITDSTDFEEFGSDTTFANPLGLELGANMNLRAVNSIGFREFVDVPPFDFTDSNGTAHASCYTNSDSETEILITFGGQFVTGFGCDLSAALGQETVELYIEASGQPLFVCAVATDNVDQFVGYGNGVAFDAVRLRSSTLIPGTTGEGFSADNFVVCGGTGIGTDPSLCSNPVPNSTGVGALIFAAGSTSAGAANVRLYAVNVPAGQAGIFFASRTLGFVIGPGGSQGNICVLGSQGRYSMPGDIFFGAGAGSYTPIGGLQVGSRPVPTSPLPGEAIVAGDTWNWQAWHRDIAGNTNFTNVVQITFTP
ncbi:MAG: hypothetical protein GY711_11745 [bacterium]|nr:hypothetical protein [bacterium]